MRKIACLILLLVAGVASAQGVVAPPAQAVVRIPSHGGSGTAIATGPGWTLVLSCAHMFEGSDRNKPIVVELASHVTPGERRKVGTRVLAVGRTEINDVSVFLVNVGPVSYVSPVAPPGHRPDPDCWSAGFDELKFPAHCRPAKIVGAHDANSYLTDARPWHGRSGGALIEKKTGYVVGVVSGYSMSPQEAAMAMRNPKYMRPQAAEYAQNAHGSYASLSAIHDILVQAGVEEPGARRAPQADPFGPQQKRIQQGPQDCPGGNCPPPGRQNQQFAPQGFAPRH